MNKYEWTKELDELLEDCVLRNYFNFELVSLEANDFAKNNHLDFGATNVYTNEKCRLRWAYIHLKVHNQLKQLLNRGRKSQRDSQQQSRNSQQKKSVTFDIPQDPKQLLSQKNFQGQIQMKESTTLGDIEAQLWKKNITFENRSNKDYLDVSKEDFSKNKTISIEGKEITPSNFNIFRDSLRQTSDQLLKTLQENLPEMNLKDIEDEEEEDEEEEEDVLPLDFRTAMIQSENKVVIQAKPLQFKTDEELLQSIDTQSNNQQFESMDAYLEAVKKEPFKDDNVILIEPDIDIKKKFEEIDLPCNIEFRINNSVNAPISSHVFQMKASKPSPPQSQKHYDTDTDNEEVKDQKTQKESLDFNNILKQWGVTDLNKLIGVSSEDETKKKINKKDDQQALSQQAKQQPKQVSSKDQEKSAQSRIGLIQSIMQENKKAYQQRQDKDSMPQSIDMFLSALQEDSKQEEDKGEDSDIAPMSALVDTQSEEERKREENRKAEKALKMASSASESEQSEVEKKKKDLQQQQEEKKEKLIGEVTAKQVEETKVVKQRRVVMYKGVKIESEDERGGSSDQKSSDDSADEYFNQQRKMIRGKLIGEKTQEFDKEDLENEDEEEEDQRDWDEDMQGFDQLMKESVSDAKQIQEEEMKKTKIEQERQRREQLQRQAEMIKAEQEKKQRERDELMEKLKRQDEERRRRKQEEKERKERERELKRRYDEDLKKKQDEDKEREQEIEMRKKQEEDKVVREKGDSERRKKTLENSIKKAWNGSDIPCLFESKIAYSNLLYSLPVELEKQIQKNEISNEDLVFRRYKTLLIPVDGILNGVAFSEIVEYFLRNSSMKIIDNREEEDEEEEEGHNQTKFPFKCIGLTMSVAMPPFNKCSLSPIPNMSNNSYRVIALLFDIYDNPLTKSNFTDTLKNIKLMDILSKSSLEDSQKHYQEFIQKLAFDYFQLNKIKDFPYEINTSKSPLLEFVNKADLDLNPNTSTLSQLSYFMEYSVLDDVVPMSTRESWDFIRRYPTFYGFNPNKKGYTKIDQNDKIKKKYNMYPEENVCVIFKDITYGQIQNEDTIKTKQNDSLKYFLKKAIVKNGLEICGLRMVYLDEGQMDLYQHLFNENVSEELEDPNKQSLLAFFIRGIDAISKVERIIGHFNPETARNCQEKSVRSFFGQNKDQNCALKMFASQKKNMTELIFWFGGRVYSEPQFGSQSSFTLNTMYVVVPPKIEKQYLFISPLITTRDLPTVIQKLTENGISIIDFQKVDFNKLQYDSGDIQTFNKDMCLFKVRGQTYNIHIGYVLKIARENLSTQIQSAFDQLQKQLGHLDRQYGSLFYNTHSVKEYQIVNQVLKRQQFKVSYNLFDDQIKEENEQLLRKKRENQLEGYDSEDTEQYRDLHLYNASSVQEPLKTIQQKQMKKEQLKTEKYQTTSFVCFIKLSALKKQSLGDILKALFNKCSFELLGLRLIDCKRQIYQESVTKEIKSIFKSLAFKFYEHCPDLKLRKKLVEFKSLALILRGRNVEQQIDNVYDREKMVFRSNIGLYETTPQSLFLTNKQILDPLFDFILKTRFIKMYNDFALNHEHLLDSPVFSYLLRYNTQPSKKEDGEEICSVLNIVEIKSKDQLFEQQSQPGSELSSCVCVIKPNQQFNVVLRTLKNIVNDEELGLKVQKIQFIKYNEHQLDLLFKHDILYDESIPEHIKPKLKEQYYKIFQDSKQPSVQVLLTGPYAISKMQSKIGHKDPKQATKDTLRSFYGVDRLDNAFFISENFSESLIERDFLFIEEQPSLLSSQESTQIKQLHQNAVASQSSLISHNQELVLVLLTPSLVESNDFIYIMEELHRRKFNICAVQKQQLEEEDINFLFGDLAPRFFNLDVLWNCEFNKGPSVMMVLEKEKGVSSLSDEIGRFEIKNKIDFEKTKKKQSALYMFNYGEQETLIQEYGSYIFGFPNASLNQKKILKFFKDLPNSQHFAIETVSQNAGQ